MLSNPDLFTKHGSHKNGAIRKKQTCICHVRPVTLPEPLETDARNAVCTRFESREIANFRFITT
jgi:hypothetical protein